VAGKLASSVPSKGSARRVLAETFVAKIRDMNADMKIPTVVTTMKATDIFEVAARALRKAHGEKSQLTSPMSFVLDLGYPPPKYMTQLECEVIVPKILPPACCIDFSTVHVGVQSTSSVMVVSLTLCFLTGHTFVLDC